MTAEQLIANLCRAYGPKLNLPPAYDGARLLWALAGCESDFGRASLPRHEDGYCYGHRYDVPALSRQWGCAAHCSYGPWQMMFAHLADYLPSPLRTPCVLVYAPGDTGDRMRTANDYLCAAAVKFINDEIIARQHASNVAEVAKAWNHGTWNDGYDDSEYVNRALRFYHTEIPPTATEGDGAPAPAPHPELSGGAAAELCTQEK